ncbi:Neutral zinc metallopeptidase, Zn-binding site [Phytophthora palmivora]|uniref:Neutral zinc metallopeptidase, Zn-binding site n=1 Tax=Phytophthora palmivora TaxID=4796 RepID=A0A2P4WYN1_9STRA|nr:Neutral zinc metallopeptidase, Zn-binding site [Phytophthora palmivora]
MSLAQDLAVQKTAGGDVIEDISVYGAPVVASTGTNHSSAVPTFGKITSKTGECVTGDPTEYISTEYLDWVWQNRIGPNADTSTKGNWNVMKNKNFLMDKFVHNNGSINYCVRWDASTNLEKNVASKFKGVLERHYNKWNKWLEGYNCWPFTKLKVNMVGFAAKTKSQFEWTDESLGKIYEGNLDEEGVPQCPDECYRFYDSVNNLWSDTSSCPGEPFDVSFWLKEDIPYGFGYDWGQEVSLADTMKNLDMENILFVGHEIGHGFGLPDFYGPETKPAKDFPNSLMMAYSSTTVTPSDGWMLRRVLDHVRDRYNF